MVNGMTDSPNPMRQRSKVSSRELPSKDFDVSLRALFLMERDKALTSKSRHARLRKVLHSCLRGPKDHIVVNILNVQEASRGTGCLIFQAEVARGTGILHNLLMGWSDTAARHVVHPIGSTHNCGYSLQCRPSAKWPSGSFRKSELTDRIPKKVRSCAGSSKW